ncbi:hypothetical protein DFW37_10185 [Clostridioides difficile]|nr:hypothetical protein [Clostridioides difficile]
MFSLNIRANHLSFSCYRYYRQNCPLLQATHFNIQLKLPRLKVWGFFRYYMKFYNTLSYNKS